MRIYTTIVRVGVSLGGPTPGAKAKSIMNLIHNWTKLSIQRGTLDLNLKDEINLVM